MARDLKDDPVALRSPLLFWAFGWYLRWFFRRNFHAVRIARGGMPRAAAGRPLIIYTNHPSWWDPALFILLSGTVLRGRVGFGPMDGAAFARYGLFRRMGIFGIDVATPRGAARFLEAGRRILSNPAHAMWITAQGHFTDVRSRPVQLRPGLAHLARRLPHAVILPLAIEYVYWNERQAEVLVRFGAPVESASANASVADWNALLEERLADVQDVLREDAVSREPERFTLVQHGSEGTGGIYDLWRRARAASRLERVQLGHEPWSEE